MKNSNYFRLLCGCMLLMIGLSFASCSDDEDNTDQPYLYFEPSTLNFYKDGDPLSVRKATFVVQTNQKWRTVKGDDWMTVTPEEGEGQKTIEVSVSDTVPAQSTIVFEVYNDAGTFLKQSVTIKKGQAAPKK